jgi:hypothetical protein
VPTYESPKDKDNFKPIVSAYKSCSGRNGGSLPLYNRIYIKHFNCKMLNDHDKLLAEMDGLIDKYIDVECKGIWLAKAVLELVAHDESISSDDVFVIGDLGALMPKKVLINESRFHLAGLLLGVWDYILMHRPDNTVGKETYDCWCKPGQSRNTREPFQSDIGSGITQEIELRAYKYTDFFKELEEEESGPESESTEPIDWLGDEGSEDATNTVVNNGLLIQQFGGGNKVFGNIGTLIINND